MSSSCRHAVSAMAIAFFSIVTGCGVDQNDVWAPSPTPSDSVLVKTILYNSNGNGNVIGIYVNDVDDDGVLRRAINYTGPGADGLWETADDIPSAYYVLAYDVAGRKTVQTQYTGAGTDGIWFTADDLVNVIEAYKYDSSDLLIQYEFLNGSGNAMGAGADGVFFTSDDIGVIFWEDYAYTNGLISKTVRRNNTGLDSLWFTSDDAVNSVTANQYDASGNQTDIVYYASGLDGLLNTSDDVVLFYFHNRYDSYGNRTYNIEYDDPGLDGIWLTTDDVIMYYYTCAVYDSNGLLTLEYSANNAGTDAKFLTADDPKGSYTTYQYLAGKLDYEMRWVAGADKVIATGDDYMTGYTSEKYDDYGNLLESDVYQFSNISYGADKIWLTSDDVISYKQIYRPVIGKLKMQPPVLF